MAKIRTFSLKIFMLKVSYCFQSLSVASRAASTMLSMANMGLDTRKPVLGGGGGGCEQHRRRPACASAQSDQRLFYSCFGKYHI